MVAVGGVLRRRWWAGLRRRVRQRGRSAVFRAARLAGATTAAYLFAEAFGLDARRARCPRPRDPRRFQWSTASSHSVTLDRVLLPAPTDRALGSWPWRCRATRRDATLVVGRTNLV